MEFEIVGTCVSNCESKVVLIFMLAADTTRQKRNTNYEILKYININYSSLARDNGCILCLSFSFSITY